MLSDSAELVEIKQKYNNYFHINWNLTNKCNFSCEYCHPYNYAGTSPQFELQHYIDFVTKVKSYLNDDEELLREIIPQLQSLSEKDNLQFLKPYYESLQNKL